MTDDDYDALSQRHLASIKRDMRISLEDAAVRATHKVMAEIKFDDGSPVQEPVALHEAVISAWSLREVYFDEDGEPSMHRSPPQRPWVGLTVEERNACLVSADPCEALADPEAKQLMEDIEAALRSKNT